MAFCVALLLELSDHWIIQSDYLAHSHPADAMKCTVIAHAVCNMEAWHVTESLLMRLEDKYSGHRVHIRSGTFISV